MKLVLINPRRIGRYVIQPPLGLGYLASIAKKYCSSVELWDMGINRKTYNEKIRQLEKLRHDLVGISIFTSDISEVNKILNLIKTNNSGIKILVGGSHPTAVKGDIFKYIPFADYAFHGEGEIGFERFLIKMTNGKQNYEDIPGLIYRDSRENVVVNSEEEIGNLDEIDFPAWDLMKPSDYPPAPHGAFLENYPTAPIIFTRGCPMHCTFCLGANRKPRKRSIENIKEEIRLLVNEFNVRELLVEDENFSIHRKLLDEFCNFMIDEYKGQLTWSCASGLRLDSLNADNVKLMKTAGCHSISVGVEFGTEKMHKETRKELHLDLIKEKLKLLHSVRGINVTGFFLMGLPQETKEDIRKTINFACALPIQRAQFNCFMPQPGTVIWNQFSFQNINFNKFHVHSASYKHPNISIKEVKGLQSKAYLKFYLRLPIIFSTLKKIYSPTHFFYLAKRFLNSIL